MRLQQNVLLVFSLMGLDIEYVHSKTHKHNILEDPKNKNLSDGSSEENVCHSSSTIATGDESSTCNHIETHDSEINDQGCQIYMAESSIPNAGLGLYTSQKLEKGHVFNDHAELVLSHVDLYHNYRMSQLFTKDELEDWKDVIGNKVDSRENCPILAIQEECQANPGYMLTVCSKSCALKQAGLEVKKSLFALRDQGTNKCLGWALADQCVENPSFMYETCPNRCVAHEYGVDTLSRGAYKDWLPHNYYWNGEGIGILYEADGGVHGIVPGIGALANAHFGLVNIGLGRHSVDSAGYDRYQDVGVGAFSDRHNLTFEAKADIPAGMELFLNYGEGYFQSKEKKFSGLEPIPFKEDYQKADALLSNFLENNAVEEMNAEKVAALYHELHASIDNARVKAAMPNSYANLKKVNHTTSSALISVPNAIRSNEWLQSNGICLDTLRPGISATPQAGRGAFAKRPMMQGEMISPMPLIQMSRNRLRRFREMNEITPELTINYSFGHRNSSMVLLPYAPTVNFINNNLNKSKVNARVQWSNSKHHQEKWEHDSVEDILKRGQGLMLELIAIQNIEEGDEIFLDYGERWDASWNDYIERWKPPRDRRDNPYSVQELNTEVKVRTTKEQEKIPYGNNVGMICRFDIPKLVADGNAGVDTFMWKNYRLDANNDSKPASDYTTRLCNVDKRYSNNFDKADDDDTDGSFLYDVLMEFSFPLVAGKHILMKGVPRSAIEFINREYKSDQFIKNAFRHVIGIDEIFPKKWMDLVL